ncbi:unnamed protein product [Caenorhabditis nigoni]
MDTHNKEISKNEPKLEIPSTIDAFKVQYPFLPIMPGTLSVGNNTITTSHPTVNLQMALMNQIRIDLMGLTMQAMASPLSSHDWITVAAQHTAPIVQVPQYPSPIWTPDLINSATQNMKDTVPAALEVNEEEDVKANEAPKFPNVIFPAKTNQLEQKEPTSGKSDCKKCYNCSITESCQWRNVTSSEGILCNACFTYQRKYKMNRPMKAIQDYKKRQIELSSSPTTQLARKLAMDPLVSFPATQLASAPSTPKRCAMDPLSSFLALPTPATQLAHASNTSRKRPTTRFDISSLLASPTSTTPLAMDPTASLMSRPSPATELAMEDTPTWSQLAQDPTSPLLDPAMLLAQNPTTPKRNGQRKLFEKSQKCSNCSITNSCQWRNVKSKESILCNACFTYQRKYKKNRPMSAIQDYKKKKIDVPIITQMLDDLPLPLISMEEEEEMTRESVQEILDRVQELADRDAAKREASNL